MTSKHSGRLLTRACVLLFATVVLGSTFGTTDARAAEPLQALRGDPNPPSPTQAIISPENGGAQAISGSETSYQSNTWVPYLTSAVRGTRDFLDRRPAGGASPDPAVSAALQKASAATGVSHDFLWRTARRESGFRPDAAARTSSALGLFQFIESTWLEMIFRYGDRHGLGEEAAMISINERGRLRITDAAQRRRVLALRRDPLIASMLAAELAQQNRRELAHALGRSTDDGELYIAHFLGVEGAARLIQTAEREPWRAAADMFPSAASSNRSIFFSRGVARSLEEVVKRLVS